MTDLVPGNNDDKEDKPDRYYRYMDDKNRIHVVDILTGDIVRTAPDFEAGLVPGQNMSPVYIKGSSKFWHYNETYRDIICQKVSEGMSLSRISKLPGFPSTSIIAKWRIENQEFEEAYRAACRARAESYADRIADSLDETRELTKDEIPAEKLYTDKLKWLAEKNDPSRYGSKKTEGEGPASVSMVIQTGVPLEEEQPVTIEVQKENE